MPTAKKPIYEVEIDGQKLVVDPGLLRGSPREGEIVFDTDEPALGGRRPEEQPHAPLVRADAGAFLSDPSGQAPMQPLQPPTYRTPAPPPRLSASACRPSRRTPRYPRASRGGQ